MATPPRTLYDKVYDSHVVRRHQSGQDLVYIDRHYAHEGSFHAFEKLSERRLAVRRPDRTFAVADHYVPTARGAGASMPEAADRVIGLLGRNAAQAGISLFGPDDRRQGIVHVIGPEQGLTLPGLTIVCGDSHTATHGAFGALAFGIGASQVAHVLATQTLWQRRLKTFRVAIDGTLPDGVTAKDVILSLIARIGTNGAAGHVLHYAGSTVSALSMEARMTLCNMSIEAGARAGMIAPDDTAISYLAGRPHAPAGAAWDSALADWRDLAGDPDAEFDRVLEIDAAQIAPMVTWGTSPEQALPITDTVPDPDAMADPSRRAAAARALDYIGLTPGTALTDIAVDRVFIGSCTNARIEDLRSAAAVLRGRRSAVPGLVVPGSTAVKRQAEAEGLDTVFRDAGLDWRESGCSMCVGINGDRVPSGQRCASTTNRNFPGRQGAGARTHLMSPAMVAAAAVAGRLTDVRRLLDSRA